MSKEVIEANKDRSFFVYLPTNAPHSPYRVAEKYSEPYVEKGLDAKLAAFYGMITNIDENIGRLMRRLKELRLEENTIFVFTTDNGSSGVRTDKEEFPTEGFNAGMRGRKGRLYDGGHRVPCFIRWPAGRFGRERDIDRLAAHIDIMPTLIEMCELKKPDNVNPVRNSIKRNNMAQKGKVSNGVKFDGKSLIPLLTGQAEHWPDRTLFVQYRQSTNPPIKWDSAVMTDRWRLIRDKELYDIKTDPGQKNNIASKHPGVVSKLRRAYEDWWTDVSKRFDRHCHIIIGANLDNPAKLTGFHWHTDRAPWSQGHVRRGVEVNGFLAVQVARGDEYEFELRRWPQEVNQPITATLPGGKAVRATEARLKIADLDVTKPVPDDACVVVFRVRLKAGKTRLQTWFTDDKTGQSRGAYYVYVKRLR